MGEATHGSDCFLGQIKLCGGVVLDHLAIFGVDALANAVDLLVDFSAVMITLLATSGHREGHTSRMPGSNTGNLTQTLVGLTRQLLCVPTGSHTCKFLQLLSSSKHTLISYQGRCQITMKFKKKKKNTFVSFALGDTNNINGFISSEDIVNWHSLLQVLTGPVYLLADGTTINLDLHNVGFLLPLSHQLHLQHLIMVT